ncbi:cytochrome P450 4V2-like [Centruroides sculpturatus]|uniref:cytochrome P450 4V2-like n=1 Tax=Centruroides sculpturatus TaxID=218467 RepID=UPI000C6E2F14|nr:cytochrome P450 4V2-like [Centruroides sculpturatus]
MIYCPEFAEVVLNNSDLVDKNWPYNFLHGWLGTGLLTSSGTKWRNRRKLLTPAFHFRILDDFISVFNRHSCTLVKKLENSNGQEINVISFVSLCTLDIIGDSAMGVHLKAQEFSDSKYVQKVKNISHCIMTRSVNPWYWFNTIFYLSKLRKLNEKCLKTLHTFTKNVIKEKKVELTERLKNESVEEEMIGFKSKKNRAFLDLLLYHHLVNGNLSEEDVREEVDTFMFEGHDTTAMGISWTLYFLGLYKDIQNKVYEELFEIFGDDKERSITSGDVKQMKYLECVIKESMRLCPPVPFIARYCNKEINIGEYKVSKGSTFLICINNIHRDPNVFPNPELFDPDRFLLENSSGRSPFAYIPFSAGPRNCIGQKFALMEEKIVLANVIRNFKFTSMQQRNELLMDSSLILRPLNGIKMIFEKR